MRDICPQCGRPLIDVFVDGFVRYIKFSFCSYCGYKESKLRKTGTKYRRVKYIGKILMLLAVLLICWVSFKAGNYYGRSEFVSEEEFTKGSDNFCIIYHYPEVHDEQRH